MQKIKVYGERNSGTIYLEWLLLKNMEITIPDDFIYGWKHRVAPSGDELIDWIKSDIVYLCLVKNPYSWLISMHKRPYNHEILRKTHFSEFIRFSYGDYRNPMVMWNIKNRSYLEMEKYVDRHMMVRYEDLLAEPKDSLIRIAEKFGLPRPGLFKNIKNLLTNNHGVNKRRFHSDYYLEEKWREKLKPEYIEYINRFLDFELMDKLGYEKL